MRLKAKLARRQFESFWSICVAASVVSSIVPPFGMPSKGRTAVIRVSGKEKEPICWHAIYLPVCSPQLYVVDSRCCTWWGFSTSHANVAIGIIFAAYWCSNGPRVVLVENHEIPRSTPVYKRELLHKLSLHQALWQQGVLKLAR